MPYGLEVFNGSNAMVTDGAGTCAAVDYVIQTVNGGNDLLIPFGIMASRTLFVVEMGSMATTSIVPDTSSGAMRITSSANPNPLTVCNAMNNVGYRTLSIGFAR